MRPITETLGRSRAGLPEQVGHLAKEYESRPVLEIPEGATDTESAVTRYLLYVLMPMWTACGVLDWYWHKKTDIEHTSGTREALIHALMFTEIGAPIVLAMLLKVNAGLLALMSGLLVTHEATAAWDVSYAVKHREVKPAEQHTHSFLEVLPVMALSMIACLHWDEVQALFGKRAKPDWALRLKDRKLSWGYRAALAGMILGGVVIPFGNELWRCLRARKEPHYNTGFYPEGEGRREARPQPIRAEGREVLR